MIVEDLHINDLPLEMFIEILLKCDGNSLGRCRRVCKRWKESIDDNDYIWQEMCRQEFRYSAKIAKRKSGNDCNWYHIFRNLKQWSDLTHFEKNVKEFYKFTIDDKSHILDIDYGVLPLKDSKGILLYDASTLKYIPVALPEINCLRIANNDRVTVILLKSGLFIQRTVDTPDFVADEFFKADNFILTTDILYFYNNRDIFKCDLLNKNLTAVLILHCDYDIKDIQYSNKNVHIFTENGTIVNITKNMDVFVQHIRVPIILLKQLKNICAVNNNNFVFYARNVFIFETDKYGLQNLYFEFPLVTALFFYVDVVLIATRAGEILLYRLSSRKKSWRPIFETLATLPEGKYAVQLDVFERKNGPVIVASTFFELYLLDINFFPYEPVLKKTFSNHKLHMYKRLHKLKDKLQKA